MLAVSANVFSMEERFPSCEDEDWFEYEVELIDTERGETLDRWDSYFETYNGMPGQRLSREDSADSIAEIRYDVEHGEADDWFKFDKFPLTCPRCESGDVEEKSFGVSCSNIQCMWKRWDGDKLGNYSAEIHEDKHE